MKRWDLESTDSRARESTATLTPNNGELTLEIAKPSAKVGAPKKTVADPQKLAVSLLVCHGSLPWSPPAAGGKPHSPRMRSQVSCQGDATPSACAD